MLDRFRPKSFWAGVKRRRTGEAAVVMIASLLAAAWVTQTLGGQTYAAPTPPSATISRYMSTVDGGSPPNVTGRMYDIGCNDGRNRINGLEVMSFGQPDFVSPDYGADIFGTGAPFESIYTIKYAVSRYLHGYWDCSPTGVFLTLAIGVNNGGSKVNNPHGAAWADMVNQLNNFIASPPSWASQERVVGAIDAEAGYAATGPSSTRAWADGYTGTATPFYNAGDCPGCPQPGSTMLPIPGTPLQNGWYQDDIWYMSWGNIGALAVPEIYLEDGTSAREWEQLSLWALRYHNSAIGYQGSATEHDACMTPSNVQYCQTNHLNNTRDQGWSQLWDAENGDPGTASSTGSLHWSTDWSWTN